ncbi:MAG: chorismate synthase [Candidatus Omnitrophica bacterium]|nr:chorismate synthase [Candidatus Omnitrophota bacterium]
MASNSFGNIFKITTFGESHGVGIGVVIDGIPPNLVIKETDIQHDLDRRKPGQSAVTTPRQEADKVEILSGVFEGKSTGAPIALLVRNSDQRTSDYDKIKGLFRPGHADYTTFTKYGIRDHRGGGRASGRETIGRVAAGAIAKKILEEKQINIAAYTLAIGDIVAKTKDFNFIEKNPVRTVDPEIVDAMVQKIEFVKAQNDSIGGIIETVVSHCPAGLGDPIFEKLNANLAYAMLSIGGIRGIEFGEGFAASRMTGSQHNDKFYMDGKNVRTLTNHAGGILGGMSNGENIIFRLAVKPTSSIAQRQATVNKEGKDIFCDIGGRHDPCLCPRMVPVVEAMTAIVLVDALMAQQAIKYGV